MLLNLLSIFIEFSVDCLGPYIQLLHKIAQDESVKNFLCRNSKRTSSSTTSFTPSPELTKEDIPQVKHRLKKAITKHSVAVEPERNGVLNRSKDLVLCTPSVMSWVQRRPSMSWDFSSKTALSVPGLIQYKITDLKGCSAEIDISMLQLFRLSLIAFVKI